MFVTPFFLFAGHGWGPSAVKVTADTKNGGEPYLYKIRPEGPWTNMDEDFRNNTYFDIGSIGPARASIYPCVGRQNKIFLPLQATHK